VDSGRGPTALALLVFTGACVAAFVLGTPPLSKRGDEAATSLLDAWRASRLATFVADYDFTRTLPDGARLEQATRTVQRPPNDRLVIGFGTAAGRLGGHVYRCAPSPTAAPSCITAVQAVDYGEEVDGDVASLESSVRGPRPAYDVIEFAGGSTQCFRLDLAIAVPSPPYGDHALFCFDRSNHAPTLTVIERPEATDRTQARSVRTAVTDADLQVADLGQVIGVPGPTTTTTTTTTTPASTTTVPAN
jgi:hypothetical protein